MNSYLQKLRYFEVGQAFLTPHLERPYVVKYVSKASKQVEAKNLLTGKTEVFDDTYLAKRP